MNNLGYHLADQGRKLEEAEKLIRTAIEIDQFERTRLGNSEPESGVYLDSLGWVLFRRGKLEEAKKVLEKSTSLPDSGVDAVVWDHLGDVRFRLGQKAGAQAAWKKAEELYKGSHLGRQFGRLEDVRKKLLIAD